MRKAIGILLLLLSGLGLISKERPNIILVFIDDMGWGSPARSGGTAREVEIAL